MIDDGSYHVATTCHRIFHLQNPAGIASQGATDITSTCRPAAVSTDDFPLCDVRIKLTCCRRNRSISYDLYDETFLVTV